jgi:hypothetical protein
MRPAYLLGVATIAAVLSGCSLNDVLKPNQSESTPVASRPAASTSVSREDVADKAAGAMGAKVVARKGEYLLCNLIDVYKQTTTNYYVCREQKCAGKEVLAQDASVRMTKSACLTTCRKREREQTGDPNTKSYCVH